MSCHPYPTVNGGLVKRPWNEEWMSNCIQHKTNDVIIYQPPNPGLTISAKEVAGVTGE